MKQYQLAIFVFIFSLLALLPSGFHNQISQEDKSEYTPPAFDGPGEFLKFQQAIRTPDDLTRPSYEPGYLVQETKVARNLAATRARNGRTQNNGVSAWTEHGPVNVPGRTRGLIVDPADPNRNTWYAGSASGGVWKTTNGGQLWTLITPDLPNLATTVLAMAPSNPNTIYIGTGEGFGNLDGVSGNGMYKSIDRGVTWTYLPATAGFSDVNRAIVDPNNQNILVVATNTGVYRSVDGGTSFSESLTASAIQDLKATPGNFQIQYATENGEGVWKSVDGGVTWLLSNTGMKPVGRVEIDISPVKPNRIFASAEVASFGDNSKMLMSDDAGATWSIVDMTIGTTALDHLDDQGWYNNTLMCDLFDANIFYVGGVDLFRTTLSGGTSTTGFYDVTLNNSQSYLTLVNFNGTNGTFDIGPSANQTTVEVRFGPGRSQKAHRFLVPEGAASGVAAANYTYANYVDVPFEVWDVTNNRQLMVSFRDQGRDGLFDLIPLNTSAAANLQSREYVFISNVVYNATAPNASIATTGGHEFSEMYFFWPTLTAGGTFPPPAAGNLTFRFNSQQKLNATTSFITDGRGQYGDAGFNSIVHVDHHNLVAIPMSASTYKILNANDGGISVSNTSATPGIANGTWSSPGNTYNTSQFYGADKRPGKNQFVGGTQDNGTWVSPVNVDATRTTAYTFAIGGDGFEAIWHNNDDRKLIGGFQGNGFRRSVDGGATWGAATSGLSGSAPFISKLANSRNNPEVVFALSSSGVFRSLNFGASWILTPITTLWGAASSTMDVEVSRASGNIVWAGSRITGTGRIHVSTDGGVSFTPTSDYTVAPLGNISKLGSHPTQPNTAYAIFSFQGRPKILRTTDLGNSWQDITGFGSGSASSNGFPDVAVYCIYVRPDNPNIIWAGTEIGIVESQNAGGSWTLLEEFPNISVWDMKGMDNQIIIATHGRGIWTATIDKPQLVTENPIITQTGTSPQNRFMIQIQLPNRYDSTQVFINETRIGRLGPLTAGTYNVSITNQSAGLKDVRVVGYRSRAPFSSPTFRGEQISVTSPVRQYYSFFEGAGEFALQGFTVQALGDNSTLQTEHNYAANKDYQARLRIPIIVNSSAANFSYRDVALVEPGVSGAVFGQPGFKDFVVVEGTKDGLTWLPIANGYNSSQRQEWLTAFQNGTAGTTALKKDQSLDLRQRFQANDTVLLRFRMFSDQSGVGWGWSIDDLYIQLPPVGLEKTWASEVRAYPNPARDEIRIRFSLPTASKVSIQLMASDGKRAQSHDLGIQPAGQQEEIIQVSDLTPGIYMLQVDTQFGRAVQKMVIQR